VATSPLEQFRIEPIIPIHVGGVDLSFTKSSAWMLAAVALASLLLWLGLRRPSLVPGRAQAAVEALAETVDETIVSSAGPEARKYFPLIFTVFLFILIANVAGLLPYSFTVTSHIIVTFALAATAFVGITLVGIANHGIGFVKMFVPSGVPKVMLIILVPIEVISYFIRPISLSVRLFANMMAGHVLLKVLAGFVILLGIAGILPLLAIVAMTALELLVAVLQAYVFTVLVCVYLNDAIQSHH
jgi:F-type H+-transporting ATPase subunit a